MNPTNHAALANNSNERSTSGGSKVGPRRRSGVPQTVMSNTGTASPHPRARKTAAREGLGPSAGSSAASPLTCSIPRSKSPQPRHHQTVPRRRDKTMRQKARRRSGAVRRSAESATWCSSPRISRKPGCSSAARGGLVHGPARSAYGTDGIPASRWSSSCPNAAPWTTGVPSTPKGAPVVAIGLETINTGPWRREHGDELEPDVTPTSGHPVQVFAALEPKRVDEDAPRSTRLFREGTIDPDRLLRGDSHDAISPRRERPDDHEQPHYENGHRPLSQPFS